MPLNYETEKIMCQIFARRFSKSIFREYFTEESIKAIIEHPVLLSKLIAHYRECERCRNRLNLEVKFLNEFLKRANQK